MTPSRPVLGHLARALALVLLSSGPATAQGHPLDLKKAQVYVDLGTELFDAGDFRGALAEFERAEPLVTEDVDRAALRFNIARCLEELGQYEEAISAFDAYLEVPDDRATRRRARKKQSALVPRVFGRIRVECEPKHAHVVLDGDAAAESPCPADWSRIPPGPHTIEARLDAASASVDIAIEAGGDHRVRVVLPGLLRVTAAAAGAQVWLDDRGLGAVPIEAASVAPGMYRVTVRAPGHIEWKRDVIIDAGTRTDLRAMPQAIAVDTAPPPPTRSLEPWLMGSGAAVATLGGYFWWRAGDDVDRMRRALDRYDAADAPDAARSARRDAEAAGADARRDRALGYGLVVAGVGLAAWTAWRWWRSGEPPAAGVRW